MEKPEPTRGMMEPVMTWEQANTFWNWLMASDPWPLSGGQNEAMVSFADRLARKWGFEDWIVAFHYKGESEQRPVTDEPLLVLHQRIGELEKNIMDMRQDVAVLQGVARRGAEVSER